MNITDNGKGFDMNRSDNGNGLKNIKRRIEKWRGKAIVESVVGKGTMWHIVLPANKPSLKKTIWKWLSLR
jgi:two-component system NarL family sensor kinase